MLIVIAHGRRELVHVNVTAHPTAAWVWRQVVEATAWGHRPRFLLRDRDAVYGGAFAQCTEALGVETLLTPVRAPRANAVAERVIGTLRRECLDHVIVLSEAHLRTVLAEFTRFYNRDRPHRTLQLQAPRPAAVTRGGRSKVDRYSAAFTTCTSAPLDRGPHSAPPQDDRGQVALEAAFGAPV